MSSKPVSVALSILSAGAVACAAASCSESSSGTPSDGGIESASGSGSGSSTGGSGSSSGFVGGSSGASSSSGSGSGSSGSGSGGADAGDAAGGGTCVGTASQALIDDMSAPTGTAIAFKPPACAQKGTWFNYPGMGGGTITPTPFAFSMVPAGLPADAGTPDAGPSNPDGGEGGASTPKAACISGATGTAAYSSTGMGFNFATTPNPDGGFAIPVAIDAHTYTGIEFWAWGGPIEGGAQTQVVTIQAYDKNETPGFGVCDPAASGSTACGPMQSVKMFASGWQSVQIPFAAFAANVGYGDQNEMMLDPTTLTKIQWQVQLSSPDGGSPVPFNFCVVNVAFY